MLWCQPTAEYWSLTTNNAECTSYHAHTALELAFNVPNTILVMLIPVAFIPTPRRVLLAILLLVGLIILVAGIVSRALILTTPSSLSYLYWTTTESSLSICFANLPFLTSFVTTAAPKRLRHISSHLAMSQWPRSRRGSFEMCESGTVLSTVRSSRVGSTATTLVGLPSPVLVKSPSDWAFKGREMQDEEDQRKAYRESSSESSREQHSPLLATPPSMIPQTCEDEVPKMRLSGGLAEMGQRSPQETQGWPIYWK